MLVNKNLELFGKSEWFKAPLTNQILSKPKPETAQQARMMTATATVMIEDVYEALKGVQPDQPKEEDQCKNQ